MRALIGSSQTRPMKNSNRCGLFLSISTSARMSVSAACNNDHTQSEPNLYESEVPFWRGWCYHCHFHFNTLLHEKLILQVSFLCRKSPELLWFAKACWCEILCAQIVFHRQLALADHPCWISWHHLVWVELSLLQQPLLRAQDQIGPRQSPEYENQGRVTSSRSLC